MAAYLVLEPPEGDAEKRAVRARLIRDGFSWLAFLFPVPWFLFHRLWIEALVALAATFGVAVAAELLGLGHGGTALSLLVSLAVGLEGEALRAAALRRRGWREWGVVEAENREEAEMRYLTEAEMPSPLPAGPSSTMRGGLEPMLGMLSYPGGRP